MTASTFIVTTNNGPRTLRSRNAAKARLSTERNGVVVLSVDRVDGDRLTRVWQCA